MLRFGFRQKGTIMGKGGAKRSGSPVIQANDKIYWAGSKVSTHKCVCGKETRRGMLVMKGADYYCSYTCVPKVEEVSAD